MNLQSFRCKARPMSLAFTAQEASISKPSPASGERTIALVSAGCPTERMRVARWTRGFSFNSHNPMLMRPATLTPTLSRLREREPAKAAL